MNFSLGRRFKNLVKVVFLNKKEFTNSSRLDEKGDTYDFKKVYYADGPLKAEIHTKNGKLDGQANLYYESGNIKAREFYRNNSLQGISRWYYESGELQSEKYFDEGRHIYTKEYDKNGHLITEKKY